MRVEAVLGSLWNMREGPVVLATVAAEGLPNATYCEAVNIYGDDKVVIADNGFEYTRLNVLAGSLGAILFTTNDGRSFQLKGPLEYYTRGDIYDDMLKWLYPRFSGKAAIVLTVDEVHAGSTKLLG